MVDPPLDGARRLAPGTIAGTRAALIAVAAAAGLGLLVSGIGLIASCGNPERLLEAFDR